MKLITTKEEASKASVNWKNTYFRNGVWSCGADKEATYHKLIALGNNPTPDEVNYVIGDISWTATFCNECGKSVDEAVQLGQEPDYDSATASICKTCLISALELMK